MRVVGKSEPRHDARDKVTGAAKYPADLVRADMLHLKAVFAGRAHARILGIDTSAALREPGVVAVFTAADVPYNRYGLIAEDQPVLCGDVVRYAGDRVALVVANSTEAAAAAARLVRVEYEELPAVTNAREALAAGAPLVHPENGTNVVGHVRIHKGNVAEALERRD